MINRHATLAKRSLRAQGSEPYPCASEDEARARAAELIDRHRWPLACGDSVGQVRFRPSLG